MRVSDYLINPAGGGITAGNPKTVREGYDIHYGSMLKKLEKNQTNVRFFNINGAIYVHIQVPSETVDDFYYDVVLEFTPTNDTAQTFNTDDIRFFSNSPSFVYTYAYIYNENNLLIKELCGKYENEILGKKPGVRNPIRYVGYEKTTYFALKYFMNRFNSKFAVGQSAATDIKDLIRSIKSNDDKKLERNFKEKEQKKEKERQAEVKRRETHNKNIAKRINTTSNQTGISVILPTKSTGGGSGVSNAKRVKSSGRIPKRK